MPPPASARRATAVAATATTTGPLLARRLYADAFALLAGTLIAGNGAAGTGSAIGTGPLPATPEGAGCRDLGSGGGAAAGADPGWITRATGTGLGVGRFGEDTNRAPARTSCSDRLAQPPIMDGFSRQGQLERARASLNRYDRQGRLGSGDPGSLPSPARLLLPLI